jgi:hypothetical protein
MKYNSVKEVVLDLEKNPAERSGNIYHPMPFPEFSHLKTSTNKASAFKKLKVILNAAKLVCQNNLKDKTLLDVGANGGFYTFSLAKEGMSVTSFEPHDRYSVIGGFLAKEKFLNVDWKPVSFDENLIPEQRFDLTLMLSVFQWMSDGHKNIDNAFKQLRYISSVSENLIFELGFNTGKSCITTTRKNHYAELIRLLQDNTNYSFFKLIGTTSAWGFRRNRFIVLCSNNKELDDSAYRKLIRNMCARSTKT